MKISKIYVDLKMTAGEKTLVVDHMYFDLIDFTMRLARHEKGSEVEVDLKSYYEKCNELLSSMGRL